MANLPQQMTTAQLRAMISGGAKREDLPTKTNGRSVVSTRDSASKAYQAQLDKIARTKSFKERSASLTMKDARDIIAGTKLFESKGEIRRLIKQGAVKLNDQTNINDQIIITKPDSNIIIRAGKRRYFKVCP